ncbi:hypothetical protein V8E36_004588 [Tilletia maclaganii]
MRGRDQSAATGFLRALNHAFPASAAPPRCQQGCFDPTGSTQKALRASCSCGRWKGKNGEKLDTLVSSVKCALQPPLVFAALPDANTPGSSEVTHPPPGAIIQDDAEPTETEAQALMDEVDAVVAMNAVRVAQIAQAINDGRTMPAFATNANIANPPPSPGAEDRRGAHANNQEHEADADDHNMINESANSDQGQDAMEENTATAVQQGEKEVTKEKKTTEREQQDIWYVVGEKKNKRILQGLWRVIKSGAELSSRTETAMIIGWATLEPGKHKQREVFWASENLCDPARPLLYSMTQEIHNRFHHDVAAYRQAQIATAAKHAAEKVAWQAERIEMLARIAALQEQAQTQSSSSSAALLDGSSRRRLSSFPHLMPPNLDWVQRTHSHPRTQSGNNSD